MNLPQATRHLPKHHLRRPAFLPIARNQARAYDDHVLKVNLGNLVFRLAFHTRIAHGRVLIRAGGGDEDVCLDAGFVRFLSQLDVQVVVDLLLIREAAGVGARGA